MNSKEELIKKERLEQREDDFKDVLLFFLFSASGITIAALILIYFR